MSYICYIFTETNLKHTIMETIKIKMYFEAARVLMGKASVAEKWLDNNSHRLTGKISSIKDAKQEILNLA